MNQINSNNSLTTEQVKQQLKTFGHNELISSKPKNIWRIALEVMKEPMFILLICCGVLYMILGDYKEGIIMLSTIFIIISITFFQHRKTEKALDALKKLSSPRALVIRDGVEMRIPGREVVPDDLIIINEGDRIPADAIVIETNHLMVDESLLTGESVPVAKSITDPTNKIFSSTLVTQGRSIAKVIATGTSTEFGKIGKSLQQIESTSTRLQKEMKILIKYLLIMGAIISIAVVILYYITRGNLLQSILNGLAASMAILPEEFPVVLTVFLALGAWRLSKIKVLTRKPTAIETLGSATVLCTDKTGTITQNKMEVVHIYDGNSNLNRNQLITVDQTFHQVLFAATFASAKDSVDPMEKAIKISYEAIKKDQFNSQTFIKEYPLTKETLAMTYVYQSDGKLKVYSKGAPEAIIGLCKLNSREREKHLIPMNEMASKGYRVIAVASGNYENENLPNDQSAFDLQFMGLIAFEDPIRPEVPDAIIACREAGVKVIMITGDYPTTAKTIASQIGFSEDAEVMTGDELNQLTDQEFAERIKSVRIFARVVPDQKLRIVQALKANNEIVAMTGDGVNDAPALKAADIGIAMGNKGTDVAREASALVLLDDNFASIVSAIQLGRRIFDNLQKAMSYIMAIHIPIIGLTLIPSFIDSLPLMLLPLHIVFMELIIDPVCSIAFEWEKDEKGIMNRPPRSINDKFFGIKKVATSILQGLLLLSSVFIVYFLSLREGHSEGEIRAIAFSSLIIGNIFLILTNLSRTRSFISVLFEKNFSLYIILTGAIGLLVAVISIPALQKLFGFQFPGFRHFISSITAAFSILLVLETIKFFRNRSLKRKLKRIPEK